MTGLEIHYDDDIPQSARDRIDVLFARLALQDPYEKCYRVCSGKHQYIPFYNIYWGVKKSRVFMRQRIRQADFALFAVAGTKAMGACDSYDYRMRCRSLAVTPVSWCNKHQPDRSHKQLIAWKKLDSQRFFVESNGQLRGKYRISPLLMELIEEITVNTCNEIKEGPVRKSSSCPPPNRDGWTKRDWYYRYKWKTRRS